MAGISTMVWPRIMSREVGIATAWTLALAGSDVSRCHSRGKNEVRHIPPAFAVEQDGRRAYPSVAATLLRCYEDSPRRGLSCHLLRPASPPREPLGRWK